MATTTEVTEPSALAPAEPGAPPFFSVGLAKLAIMSVVTFGLYELFWAYRNWKCAAKLTGEKLYAPLRALFYPLTSYFLFRRIEDCGLKQGVLFPMNTGSLALNAKVAPQADPNRRLGAWNIVAIVVGGALMALVLAGLFLEPPPQ